MDDKVIAAANADIETTGDLRERALKASREKKRANLRAAGLGVPSRRKHGVDRADRRLRAVFGGKRTPTFAMSMEQVFRETAK